MLPAKLTRDEHGSILDENLPSFVRTDEDYERWRVCVEAAVKISEAEETSHEVRMFATEIYRMPNPTHEPEPEPMDAEEAQLEEGRFRDWLAWLHPRGRGGQFIDTPDAPRPNAPPTISPTALKRKRTPGITLEEIEAAGLNKWPEPGAAARRILGDLRSTAELYALPQNPASPGGGDDSIIVPYMPEREARHQQIVESYVAGKWPPAGRPRVVFTAGGPASGKALALDTPVPTPCGWTTMGSVEAGDYLLDEQGAPCLVEGVSAVMLDHEVFQVSFDDGSTIRADGEHLWRVTARADRKRPDPRMSRGTSFSAGRWNARVGDAYIGRFDQREEAAEAARVARGVLGVAEYAGGSRVLTTAEMAGDVTLGTRANYAVENALPLRLPEAILPIDPYTLGAWLGDGSSADGRFTCADEEIVWRIRAAGFEVSKKTRYGWTIHGLRTLLRREGLLGAKRVPPEYRRASEKQRRALLAGLMDTDGSAAPSGEAEFTTTRHELAEGVRELAVSLGYKVRISEGRAMLRGRDCGPKWRLFLWTRDQSPFALSRKVARWRPAGLRQGRRFVTDVRRVSSEPVRCVRVASASHLFLAGRSMIPTHNSTLLGDNPHLLPPRENTVHIDVDEIKELLPEYNEMRKAGDRYAALAVHRESGDIAAKLSDRARAQGLNVIMDGTGDGEHGQFSHDLALMRDHGYTVDVIYVDIPTDIAVARAVERAEEKGRFVPIPVVRQQHRAVSRNFRDEIVGLDFLNSLIVLDNENRLAELKGGEVEILDAEGYSRFLDKADEGN